MFSQGEISQFGVNPHPLMPISDKTRLGLEMFDPRTEEEKERNLERDAQKLTVPMFSPEAPPAQSKPLLLTAGATTLLHARCLTTVQQEIREQERTVFERSAQRQVHERRILWELCQANE
jgi:hypothetical protein